MEIARNELVGRARRAGTRAISIIAPAGYGKSTFVRQLLPNYGSSVVCDLAGIRTDIDMSRRLVVALAEARPNQAEHLVQAQLSMPDDKGAWHTLVRDVWQERSAPEAFVFENAEVIATIPEAATIFQELVHASPRIVIVCSRLPLDLPYGRGLAAPDVLLIRQDDLRFTPQELDEALPNLREDERQAIGRVSRGWPVIVSLIARLIAEEGLPAIISRLEPVVHNQLYEYLASQLIASLPPNQFDVVLALAAIPNATRLDIERALSRDVYSELMILRDSVPLLIDASGETYQLHPMLVQIAIQRDPLRCQHLVRLSATNARAVGDDVRAAQLYLHINDKHAAAAAIQDVGPFLLSTPSLEFANVLASLDGESLLEFPGLWCAALMHRGYSIPPEEWLRMARHIWEHLPPGADPALRVSVFSSLLNAYTNIGRCEEARQLLDAFAKRYSAKDYAAQMMTSLFRAALESFDGVYENLETYTQELIPVFEASPLTHALYLYDAISPMYQARGETARADEILSRACELASTTALTVRGLPMVEAAFAAWFSGNDQLFERNVEEIEAVQTPGNTRGFRFFIACARGEGRSVSFGYEKMKTRAQALMIAGALSKTLAEAQSFARNAIISADASSRRFLAVIARVALAELIPEERLYLLSDASRISKRLQSQPMHDALRAMRLDRDNFGMLAPFVARYSRFHSRAPNITVRVLAGEVSVEGVPVKLTPCEFGILATLARQRRWHDAAELCEYLYPELNGESAANRLHVYVHRVRQRVAQEAIVGGRSGYRLGPTVSVDLWEAEALLRRHSGEQNALTDDERAEASILTPVTRAELTALTARAKLPSTFEYSLEALRHDLLLLRAKDALASHRIYEALTIADMLIADDPCDADGHSVRIRSLLLKGDRSAAESAWRVYRRSLKTQIGFEPPPLEEYHVL